MNVVELELARPRVIGNFEDIDDMQDVPGERLAVPAAVWMKAVGLAETAGYPVTSNPRHLLPAQTRDLAERLRAALAEKVVPPRRASGQTAKSQLREFFAAPANAKLLQLLVRFLERGGALTVW